MSGVLDETTAALSEEEAARLVEAAAAVALRERLEAADTELTAMTLALELMKSGSRQVEMSDEGMMTDEIEECLMVVIKALEKRNLPAGDSLAWCSAMLENDCVGFICCDELESLRRRFEASAS